MQYRQTFDFQPSIIAFKIHRTCYLVMHVWLWFATMPGLLKLQLVLALYLYFKHWLIPRLLFQHPSVLVGLYFINDSIKGRFASGQVVTLRMLSLFRSTPEVMRFARLKRTALGPSEGLINLSASPWLMVWPDSLSQADYRLFQMRLNLGVEPWLPLGKGSKPKKQPS